MDTQRIGTRLEKSEKHDITRNGWNKLEFLGCTKMRSLLNISRPVGVSRCFLCGSSGQSWDTGMDILDRPMSHQHKGELSNTLSSLGVKEPWWMEAFLKQEVLRQRLDGAASAPARKASFLVSQAAPCVHFSFRIPRLRLPPPNPGQTSGDHSEQRWPPWPPWARAPPSREKLAQNHDTGRKWREERTDSLGCLVLWQFTWEVKMQSGWRLTDSNSGGKRQYQRLTYSM